MWLVLRLFVVEIGRTLPPIFPFYLSTQLIPFKLLYSFYISIVDNVIEYAVLGDESIPLL